MTKLAVPSRIAAAVLGGYALTNSAAILLAALLPGGRAEAVAWAMMSSFLIYAAAIVWVFSARSASRAWVGILVPSLLFSLLAWSLLQGGQP